MVTGENGIEVTGLVREYKKGPRAVDGIDITVAPGEIYGFLGPNGAGKSTTVHVLTTLLPPTAGTALVGGYDVVKDGPKIRGLIGVALQEAALDPLLTARDHLRLQATLQSVPKEQRGPRADELLHQVGLADAADRKVALVHSPRILFLDEPTTGLDPQSRTEIWNEVALMRREAGVTVFLTTQYLEEADVLADRVGIIDQGRIVAEGTPAELKAEIGRPSVHAIPRSDDDRPKIAEFLAQFGEPLASTRDVAVRLREGLGLTDIVRAVDANGVDIADLELHAPTLDDVFLAKTGRTLEGAAEEAQSADQEKRRA
jgi:ABC-2 type transport system ATP-binding protein